MRSVVLLALVALPTLAGAQSPPPRRLPPPQQPAPGQGMPSQGTGSPAPAQPAPQQPTLPRDPGTGVSIGGSGVYVGDGWIPNAGLQAILYSPDRGRLRFSLNDQAYVTVFEVQPGRGVRVIFPQDGAPEQALPSGWQAPPLPTGSDPLAGFGAPPERGPRYLYLVASDVPMNFGPQRRTVQALSALLGPQVFRSNSAYEIASAIRTRVLSLPRGGTTRPMWTDQLITWSPGVPDPLGANAAPTVRCPNGAVYTLAPGQHFECPR